MEASFHTAYRSRENIFLNLFPLHRRGRMPAVKENADFIAYFKEPFSHFAPATEFSFAQ